MATVGRVVSDPTVASYCRVSLNSGERIKVRHDVRRGAGGVLTVEEVRWWGLVTGATVFTCDVESAEGRRLWARLVEGAPPGSARATALGALIEYVKRCPSLRHVKMACEGLVSPGPSSAA